MAREPSVLVVDDSDAVCLTLTMMLEKNGFAAQAAHTTKDALRQANENHFDVILVDRNLGPECGLTLSESLLEREPHQRIVIMSGSPTLESDVQNRPRLTGITLLQKPFDRRELLDCLRSVLHRAA